MIELIRLFTRLGATAFGGPAAHIAMLHDEVVVRREWMDEQHFLDLVGATNLIPGPNSTEMVLHVGYERAGWRGLLLAALCFITPAALMVGFLAWMYVRYGSTPEGTALLYGIKPVIIAIVLQALLKLGRKAVKGPLLAAVGVASLALYLFGINELLLLLGGGLFVMLWRVGPTYFNASLALLPMTNEMSLKDRLPETSLLESVTNWINASSLASQVVEALPVSLSQLFLTFLKVGTILYGSGYVLLAFLRTDLVLHYGWLTDQQLLDAVAVGQLTPGPLLTTSTFIGYVVAGWQGAVLATIGIFLPSIFFVAILNPIVPRLRRWEWSRALLDGINVAAVGLMGGVTLLLARAALTDSLTWLLALIAGVLLFRFRISSAWLVIGGGLLGLLLGQ